jgi:hypothetical protein
MQPNERSTFEEQGNGGWAVQQIRTSPMSLMRRSQPTVPDHTRSARIQPWAYRREHHRACARENENHTRPREALDNTRSAEGVDDYAEDGAIVSPSNSWRSWHRAVIFSPPTNLVAAGPGRLRRVIIFSPLQAKRGWLLGWMGSKQDAVRTDPGWRRQRPMARSCAFIP